MSDPSSGGESKRTLLERLSGLLVRAPEDREQLLDLLRQSHERALLDADAMSMIEGALQVSELTAGDVMVQRAHMDQISLDMPHEKIVPYVVSKARSRFPVLDGERDNVVGILHSKDLLRLYLHPELQLKDLLRPAVFIPETQRLNVLLRDLRSNRNHLAIIVDEYGSVSGLVTIEDVLEQIVGDIEDEFDVEEREARIIPLEPGPNGPRHRVNALLEIDKFNEAFSTHLPDQEFDTVGGLVTHQFGHIPQRGESIEFDGLRFEVLRANSRHLQMLAVEALPQPEALIETRSAAG